MPVTSLAIAATTVKNNAKAAKVVKDLKDKKDSAASKRDKHNKTLQIPSATLLATAAMTAAKEACAAKVDAIVEECLANNRRFRDSKFDLQNNLSHCLYSSLLSELVYSGMTGVKRVGEIIRNPVFYKDGAHPDDIRQGANGDCWHVASLATLANIPGLIEQLCVKKNEKVGVYGFIFFKDGDWVSTVVDDQLCYSMDPDTLKKSLYFSKCQDERETWLPLLEKAYAKIHGDYESLDGGFTSEGNEDLTGGVASLIFTSDILDTDTFWELEMQRVNTETLMGCYILSPDPSGERHGIISSHAYSVLRTAIVNGERIVQIRNPWGNTEWNGDWSDDSDKWTSAATSQLQHEDKDDGKFWMSYKDFLRVFDTIDLCRIFNDTWAVASSWIPYNVHPRSSGKFHFGLDHASAAVIVLSQPDTRYYGALEAEFEYTLSFHVYDGENQLVKRARSTVPYTKRSVSIELDLPAGKYTVVPHVTREENTVEVLPEDEEGDESDDSAIDQTAYMFHQQKAAHVRSLSMARVVGKSLLGVDDEDYEDESSSSEVVEADRWELMLGLRVYSHDLAIELTGVPGEHPARMGEVEEAVEEQDPEEVTATLADKKGKKEEEEVAKEESNNPSSLGISNALDVLLSYAYRYNDLKDEALSAVAKNMDTLYRLKIKKLQVMDRKTMFQVAMTRNIDLLSMRFKACIKTWNGHSYDLKRWLHLMRMDGTVVLTVKTPTRNLVNSTPVDDSEYHFYVVISRSDKLSHFLQVPIPRPMTASVALDIPEDKLATEIYDILTTLLGDIYSVDMLFQFSFDSSYGGIGLWAHRAVISKYPLLEGFIQRAVEDQVVTIDADSEFSPLTITIGDISLSTLCVLHMFIYTGKIERTVDPNKFTLSKPRTSLVILDTDGRAKSTFRWHPLDVDSLWHLKEHFKDMTIASTNTLISHTDTVLTVRCVTPEDVKDTVSLPDSDSASPGSKWKCVLTNRRPLLHISVSSCDPLSADGVKFMRIRSVQGRQLARTNVQVFENDSSALATEFPLESYCSLVYFLYKGVITTEVDLRRFAVAFNVHGLDHNKYRPSDADLSAISSTSVDTGAKRVTAVKDLFQLASMYEVNEVREYCRDKILASITASNALEILFEYAYRYSDLKDAIVQYVTDNMDELLLTGQDPFGAYSGHPQRQSILDAVLKRTLEA
ncbi:hypothetical protein BGZ82_005280 [Podila clonocystis]|nr:hypothetical protein BGZ82_005280 [Podila clonocystis]